MSYLVFAQIHYCLRRVTVFSTIYTVSTPQPASLAVHGTLFTLRRCFAAYQQAQGWAQHLKTKYAQGRQFQPGFPLSSVYKHYLSWVSGHGQPSLF
jgi:hypothetical protein